MEELAVATAQPEIIADVPKWQGMLKEMSQLEPAVNAWRQYKNLLAQIGQAKEMRADPDLAEMAEEELKELLPREEEERNQLRLFLIPHDPNDDRSVVMEIRPGAGGEEAALFAALLTGCDKLDDSDDGMVADILPGKWAFSYVIRSDEDPGLEFNYKQVIFKEDGTCAITYDEQVSYKDEDGNWHTEIVEKAITGTIEAGRRPRAELVQ